MIHTTSQALSEGQTTSVEVLEKCLERIDQLEDKVHAWVLVARDQARRDAEALDKELKQGRRRGPLHGIPIAIKDIFDVAHWPTAGGSKLWSQSYARHDSTVVQKLREAGAVLMGKTVTTQFASFDPPVTVNPWNVNHTPGGSSSGSAAAVASGMCLGAMGSQTGGSITRPASFCGIAGCKPTYGRVSCAGVMPLAVSMDHPGPMANCLTDVALLLQVIAGHDQTDPHSVQRPVPDYLARLKSDSNEPPRLGRLRGLFEDRATPEANSMMDRLCHQYQERGAIIEDIALPASFSKMEHCHRKVMAVECAAYHQARFQEHSEDYLPNIRSLIEEGLQCSATEYAQCKQHQRRLTWELEEGLDDVHALIMPGATGPAPDTSTTGDPVFNSPWSYSGFPCVSFLADWTDSGLPQAIQIVGRPWSEADLFVIGAWCEKHTQVERREVN